MMANAAKHQFHVEFGNISPASARRTQRGTRKNGPSRPAWDKDIGIALTLEDSLYEPSECIPPTVLADSPNNAIMHDSECRWCDDPAFFGCSYC